MKRSLTLSLILLPLAAAGCQSAPQQVPLATPTGLVAEAGDRQVALTWNASSEADLRGYNVYWGTSSGALTEAQFVTVPNTTTTVTDLNNGTTYYFAIDAENAAGAKSARTAEVSATPSADALPFSRYMYLEGNNSDYIEIPHDAALNPADAITLEGWVRFDAIGCVSLFGKNWQQAYWVGFCDNSFRSYLHGLEHGALRDGGTFTVGEWTHWAATWDGSVRRHYLNGELVGEFPQGGVLTSNTDPLRIGSDVAWEATPQAGLAEVRLWNVARTQEEIENTMNTVIRTALPGLVAVWPLAEDGRDALGNHHGTVIGSPAFREDVPSPATPTGLAATSGDGQVTLTWNPNGESDLAHYNVYQGTSSGNLSKVTEVPAGTETYTASGLTNDTEYFFALSAENASGRRSLRTAEVSATPFDPTLPPPPATPTGLAAIASDGEVTLTWNANAEADLAHYNVYQGTASGTLSKVAEIPAGTETYTVAGLSNGTTYYFAIDAENAAGRRSPRTAEVSATPNAPPATPENLIAMAGDEEVTLSWDANSESDLAGYNVYWGTSSGALNEMQFVAAPSTTATITGLSNGTNYLFAISAENTSGIESPRSSEVSAQPLPLYWIFGSDMSALHQTVSVFRRAVGITDATVTVNGTTLSHMDNGRYYGMLPSALAADDAITVEVIVGTDTVTGTDVIPHMPSVTGPADGSSFSSLDTITVTWDVAVSPERFVIWTCWDGGAGCHTYPVADGSARSHDIPAGNLPTGALVDIDVFAYNDGVFTGPHTPASRMSIRVQSDPATRPTITVTP